MFVSARILILLVPTAVTSNFVIENNFSELVEVKGPTDVSFTIPWIYAAYYWKSVPSKVVSVPFSLALSLYSPITVTDTTITPNIDVISWVAAEGDCQFAFPQQGVNSCYTPTPEPEQQCDIHAVFAKSFRPFVRDVNLFCDDHQVQSETTLLVTDLMKRYQEAGVLSYVAPSFVCPLDYTPGTGTIGSILNQTFLFHRGGMMYKVFFPPVITATSSNSYLFEVDNANQGPDGQASFTQFDQYCQVDFTIPWYNVVPYIDSQALTTGELGYCAVQINGDTIDDYSTGLAIVTAVRDDYQVGYLVPPNPALTVAYRTKGSKIKLPDLSRKKILAHVKPYQPPKCLGDSEIIKTRDTNATLAAPKAVPSFLGSFTLLSK